MKELIRKILVFSMPILLLTYPLDVFISKNLKKSNSFYGEYEVWNDIYNSNINANILVYGSSRAWVDINPQIIEDTFNLNVYNLGLDGHNFWLQYLRHLEFIKYNPSPKHIILAVDFNSLQKRDDLYLYEQFLPYMLWNSNIRNYTHSYKAFNYFDYQLPLLRYVGKSSILKKAFKNARSNSIISPYRNKGYRGIKKTWTNDFELAKTKMSNYKIKIDTASVNLFDKFLLECKNNKIEVSLVYTPEHIVGQRFVTNRDQVITLFKKFAKKYNLQFLDYSKDPMCLDTSFFYNATHLNKTGSELFTKKLVQDLSLTISIKKHQQNKSITPTN